MSYTKPKRYQHSISVYLPLRVRGELEEHIGRLPASSTQESTSSSTPASHSNRLGRRSAEVARVILRYYSLMRILRAGVRAIFTDDEWNALTEIARSTMWDWRAETVDVRQLPDVIDDYIRQHGAPPGVGAQALLERLRSLSVAELYALTELL